MVGEVEHFRLMVCHFKQAQHCSGYFFDDYNVITQSQLNYRHCILIYPIKIHILLVTEEFLRTLAKKTNKFKCYVKIPRYDWMMLLSILIFSYINSKVFAIFQIIIARIYLKHNLLTGNDRKVLKQSSKVPFSSNLVND